MPVIVNLDVMLARRQVRSKELAEAIGITESNLSLLKSGKVKVCGFPHSPRSAVISTANRAIFWVMKVPTTIFAPTVTGKRDLNQGATAYPAPSFGIAASSFALAALYAARSDSRAA